MLFRSQRLAESRMQHATYNYITTGSADEITLRDNVEAFRRMKVFPPLLKGVSNADLSTTVLNRRIDMPILLAPVAAQRMFHPEGALATARAAAAAKTVFAVSSSVGHSVEEVARAATGPKWFQIYVPKDRAVARQLVERVDQAGYEAIIVTVDLGEWKDADRRDRFALPKEMLVKHLRDVGYTQVTNEMSNEEVQAFNAQAWEISLSWDFFDWLRSITKTPLLIKGVLRKDDAEKAVSLGIDGIAFAGGIAPLIEQMHLLIAVRVGELWLPQVARQLATLDQMCGGRLTINIISSDLPGQAVESERRYRRTVESMHVLRQLLNRESVDFHGEFIDLKLDPPKISDRKSVV